MAPTQPAGPVYRSARIRIVRAALAVLARLLFRVRFEGRERWPTGPALVCFNHLNWADPLILLAVLPGRPRVAMFGPQEADMTKGARNRIISWAGFGIPYRPAKNDLIETTRRVDRVLADGWVVAIAGEGRIHPGERDLGPLFDGTAYFALRSRVPIVPLAISGTSWLGFRRRIRVRVGEPIEPTGRPNRDNVDAMTARTREALLALVSDAPDLPPPGPFGRWLTELFNEWPDGERPELASPDPSRDAA